MCKCCCYLYLLTSIIFVVSSNISFTCRKVTNVYVQIRLSIAFNHIDRIRKETFRGNLTIDQWYRSVEFWSFEHLNFRHIANHMHGRRFHSPVYESSVQHPESESRPPDPDVLQQTQVLDLMLTSFEVEFDGWLVFVRFDASDVERFLGIKCHNLFLGINWDERELFLGINWTNASYSWESTETNASYSWESIETRASYSWESTETRASYSWESTEMHASYSWESTETHASYS